jgi:hypothetical protein
MEALTRYTRTFPHLYTFDRPGVAPALRDKKKSF